jgi:hypothetical protein
MAPLKLFISYAHNDEDLKNRLVIHLSSLVRDNEIDIWSDREITAGQQWAAEITRHLNGADVIMLLLSADFIASDYCYEKELGSALRRHHAGECLVIPVILKPCDWQSKPLNQLQALPKNAEPVTSERWKTVDDALFDVARGLRHAIEDFRRP